ncbi:winged helix-turn-helix transcriptional regulator [Nordella sp. HKS 07]|uniref:ArsR/SmtB family transcription factor n=1 Tax=Nordella sp. HKS 07 TaxID=2712222 RepID=UPI0013E17F81|nr:metalloregulator ArsR/SmtB family transcription factor [Nordella sp. HKS 07]QIG50596.1 winged helix-turn-helix transcriptional regulator [Nordella sp. HKS 07]
MTDRMPNRIFADVAELTRSLGHPHRLQLLDLISESEHSVERLAELSGLSIANASQHLQQLKRAGFVAARRNGKHVLYGLGDGPILPLLAALCHYAEHRRAGISAFAMDTLTRQASLEAITREELLRRMREESITLLGPCSTAENVKKSST